MYFQKHVLSVQRTRAEQKNKNMHAYYCCMIRVCCFNAARTRTRGYHTWYNTGMSYICISSLLLYCWYYCCAGISLNEYVYLSVQCRVLEQNKQEYARV